MGVDTNVCQASFQLTPHYYLVKCDDFKLACVRFKHQHSTIGLYDTVFQALKHIVFQLNYLMNDWPLTQMHELMDSEWGYDYRCLQ